MSNDPIDRRDYGQLEERVAQLTITVKEHIENVQAAHRALANSIRELQDVMTEAKGGWRTVLMLGGIASAIGGAISWFISHIKIN